MKRAIVWSCVWVACAVAFGVGLAVVRGPEVAGEFAAAYLLEKSLSIDNVFMFYVVFAALAIPVDKQARVLRWGIAGALVFRLAFIAAGASVLHAWHQVTYVFGGILVVAALAMLRDSDKTEPPKVLGWLKQRWPKSPLLVALVAIELADLIFAIDSVPAGFSVTDDVFVMFAANAFALLGLRSLYIVLIGTLRSVRYLQYGLAAILAFAGGKLLVAPWWTISPLASVLVIFGCLGVTVVASKLRRT